MRFLPNKPRGVPRVNDRQSCGQPFLGGADGAMVPTNRDDQTVRLLLSIMMRSNDDSVRNGTTADQGHLG